MSFCLGVERVPGYCPGSDTSDVFRFSPWWPRMSGKSQRLGRYEFVCELHRSFLGSLWVGHPISGDGLGVPAAIRRIAMRPPVDQQAVDALTEAAWWSVRKMHPYVVQVVDVVNEGKELGIVSDYHPGDTARSLLRLSGFKRAPLPHGVVGRIIVDALEALRGLHEVAEDGGYTYGGITPDSLLIGTDGITRLVDVPVTGAASTIKSWLRHPERVAYDAPEQVTEGEVGPQADLFGIGIVLWEFLAAKRLFAGASHSMIVDRIRKSTIGRADASKPPGGDPVPESLADVCARALERDPSKRFEDAQDFADALREGVELADHAAVAEQLEKFCAAALASRKSQIETALGAAGDAPPLSKRFRATRGATPPTPPVRPAAVVTQRSKFADASGPNRAQTLVGVPAPAAGAAPAPPPPARARAATLVGIPAPAPGAAPAPPPKPARRRSSHDIKLDDAPSQSAPPPKPARRSSRDLRDEIVAEAKAHSEARARAEAEAEAQAKAAAAAKAEAEAAARAQAEAEARAKAAAEAKARAEAAAEAAAAAAAKARAEAEAEAAAEARARSVAPEAGDAPISSSDFEDDEAAPISSSALISERAPAARPDVPNAGPAWQAALSGGQSEAKKPPAPPSKVRSSKQTLMGGLKAPSPPKPPSPGAAPPDAEDLEQPPSRHTTLRGMPAPAEPEVHELAQTDLLSAPDAASSAPDVVSEADIFSSPTAGGPNVVSEDDIFSAPAAAPQPAQQEDVPEPEAATEGDIAVAPVQPVAPDDLSEVSEPGLVSDSRPAANDVSDRGAWILAAVAVASLILAIAIVLNDRSNKAELLNGAAPAAPTVAPTAAPTVSSGTGAETGTEAGTETVAETETEAETETAAVAQPKPVIRRPATLRPRPQPVKTKRSYTPDDI